MLSAVAKDFLDEALVDIFSYNWQSLLDFFALNYLFTVLMICITVGVQFILLISLVVFLMEMIVLSHVYTRAVLRSSRVCVIYNCTIQILRPCL